MAGRSSRAGYWAEDGEGGSGEAQEEMGTLAWGRPAPRREGVDCLPEATGRGLSPWPRGFERPGILELWAPSESPTPSLGPGTEDISIDHRVWALGLQVPERLGWGLDWAKGLRLGWAGGELNSDTVVRVELGLGLGRGRAGDGAGTQVATEIGSGIGPGLSVRLESGWKRTSTRSGGEDARAPGDPGQGRAAGRRVCNAPRSQ